ncbi:polysaccharide biosynthesis C-terminal domain-containing protein [Arthrobacter sp. zg-Y826]|uniref:oligosaccharide flippase family protein n=1 Tax=Arthrobacter jinronghuae TaxID=2964609 RepID=UPI0021056BBB|nr:polysaccharide biosynthesis C-terminal domain-containing protein [Arthrobacter jinronghuae]MCQ1957252.1 polysaccharide biosynthesis C-terminal domain-containing protein [Arthrobacter jinronghuae]
MSAAGQPGGGPARPPGGTLARTGTVSLLLVLSGSALAFGTTLLVSNRLGAEGAGVFFQISASFAILTTLCTFGADTGLVRFLSAGRAMGREHEAASLLSTALVPVAVAATSVAVALWVAAPAVADLWGADVEAGIRSAAPFIIIGSLMTVLFGALRGSGEIIRFAALQNLALPLLRLAGLCAAIGIGAGIGALSAAWSVPVLIVCLAAALLLRRTLRIHRTAAEPQQPRTGSGAPSRRTFWSFSGARGASSGVEILLEWVDVLAVAVFLGPAAAGVYGVVNRCIRLGSMLDHTARIVSGPSLSAALAVGDVASAARLFNSVTRLLILGAWPLYLVYLLFGAPVLRIFGEGFDVASGAFTVIAATMLLVVSAGGVQSVLLMSGRSRWQLLNKIAALAVALILNLFLVPALGLYGAVIAWSSAALVDTGLAAFQVRVFLGIGLRLNVVALPAALAFSVFGFGGWFLRWATGPTFHGLLLLLVCGGILYAVLLVALRRPLGLAALAPKPHLPQPSEGMPLGRR